MLKLYKRAANEILYWETWDKDEKTGVVHWGIVGQRGQDKEIKSGLFSNFRKEIQKGIIVQALITDNGINKFIICKADHNEFLNEINFTLSRGLPIKKKVFKGFHITYITYHNEKILSDHNTRLLDYNSFQRRQLPNTLSESCSIILYMTSKM